MPSLPLRAFYELRLHAKARVGLVCNAFLEVAPGAKVWLTGPCPPSCRESFVMRFVVLVACFIILGCGPSPANKADHMAAARAEPPRPPKHTADQKQAAISDADSTATALPL